MCRDWGKLAKQGSKRQRQRDRETEYVGATCPVTMNRCGQVTERYVGSRVHLDSSSYPHEGPVRSAC